MKIVFFDVAEFLRYAVDRVRLFNIYDLFQLISETEGDDDLELQVCFDYSETNKKYKIIQDQLVSLKKKFEEKDNRNVKLINSYNTEMKKNLPEIVLTNSMYQDYIENTTNPNQHIVAITSAKYLAAVEYIQKKTGVKARIYAPNDLPYLSQIKKVFDLAGTFDLSPDKKSVFDKLVLKQIFECLRWSMERGFYPSLTSIGTNCLDMSNIRKFDTFSMIAGLYNNKILAPKTMRNNDGDYRAVTVPDIKVANAFLAKHEIPVKLSPIAKTVTPKPEKRPATPKE